MEYQTLLKELGKNKTIKCIEQLDIYKKSKGIEYADDYATIKRWVIDRVEEIETKKQIKENKKNNYKNYSQREYPENFFDSLYAN